MRRYPKSSLSKIFDSSPTLKFPYTRVIAVMFSPDSSFLLLPRDFLILTKRSTALMSWTLPFLSFGFRLVSTQM